MTAPRERVPATKGMLREAADMVKKGREDRRSGRRKDLSINHGTAFLSLNDNNKNKEFTTALRLDLAIRVLVPYVSGLTCATFSHEADAELDRQTALCDYAIQQSPAEARPDYL